jgi:hypothetical protein
MPRDGSGNYTLPYPAVVDGTTIESAVHNGTMSDIALQLNGPLPIVAGGTGANNADAALVNLKGEKALQYVTNYDSHAFVSGSFYSTGGATGEPPGGGAQSGVCVVYGDPNFITLTARAVADGNNPGKSYVRQKVSGVWAAWVEQPSGVADLDARYVNVTGDTMSGNLTLSAGTLSLAAGPLVVYEANGITVGAGGNVGVIRFGNLGDKYLYWNSSSWTLNGGSVSFPDTTASSSPSTGALTVAGGAGIGGRLNVGNGAVVKTALNDGLTVSSIDGTFNGFLFYSGAGTLAIGTSTNHGLSFLTNNAFRMTLSAAGDLSLSNTTASTSPTTGALTVAGGVGITKDVRLGGQVHFGAAEGPSATTAQAVTDAEIVLYENAATNWAGIGADNAGHMWFKTGTSGTPVPAMWISATDQTVKITSATNSSSSVTGALTVSGGVGIGGSLYAGNNIVCVDATTPTSGVMSFGSGTAYLQYVGPSAKFAFVGGYLQAGTGYGCRSGVSGAYTGNIFNLQYTGPVALWIDVSNLGNITVTSDYRTKKDVIDLPGMWDTVKGLRPIKYTQADFTPPAQLEADAAAKAEGKEIAEGPMFKADNVERWGFIAHELQDVLIPSASTGVKDSPDHVQSPNMATVVAALTKALQEAMTRIEALEAR